MSDVLHLASGEDSIEVPSWVALYAIRWAIGQADSPAHHDALHLVRRHWPALRKWRRMIVDEVQSVIDQAPGTYEARSSTELLDWIREQETDG